MLIDMAKLTNFFNIAYYIDQFIMVSFRYQHVYMEQLIETPVTKISPLKTLEDISQCLMSREHFCYSR